MFHVPHHTPLDQQLHEPEDVGVLGQQLPVEPTRIIVLAVGVIVAALSSPHLVTHNEHGNTHGKHGGGKQVLYLTVAQPLDYEIVRWTFHAAIPTSVVIAAVAVVFAIFFVVLAIVGNDVVEGE